MKSDMVGRFDSQNKAGYTDLQVMKSAAGWYVGTAYWNTEDVPGMSFWEPGSRDSGYFSTEQEAKDFLKALESGHMWARLQLREHP